MPVVFREVALPPGLATAEILEVPSVRPLERSPTSAEGADGRTDGPLASADAFPRLAGGRTDGLARLAAS